jgi:hypothetical protein
MLAGILVGGIVLIVLMGGIYFSQQVIKPKCFKYEETYKIEVDKGKIVEEKFNSLKREEIKIKSPYGYELNTMYFEVPNSNKAVIICHGITYTLYGSVKYMDIFLKRGISVLIYDHRNHGLSGGKNTTFGHYEKYDLKAVTDWLFTRLGDGGKVGIMGESMGAATVLLNSEIDDRVSFYIADCSYSSMSDILKYRMRKDFHIYPFLLYYSASLITKIRAGIFFREVSPIKAVKNVETPIFFIHGKNDDYVPYQMSIDMYNAKKNGFKKIYLAPNAGHAEAYWNNRDEYDRLVGEFLEQIGF